MKNIALVLLGIILATGFFYYINDLGTGTFLFPTSLVPKDGKYHHVGITHQNYLDGEEIMENSYSVTGWACVKNGEKSC